MAKGTFIIDKSVSKETREEIAEKIKTRLGQTKNEISEREPILKKRQDFYEGNHHKWTNVIGQVVKQQEGHILAIFNYVSRFCRKLHWVLTNSIPRIKISAKDESNEIETSRAEAVEQAIYDVLRENKFFEVIYKRLSDNQIRDGDFVLNCRVTEGGDGKKIVVGIAEDLLKISVGWDDAAGTSFSFIAFQDLWSVDKIKREFDYEAEPIAESKLQAEQKGSHVSDQFGLFATTYGGTNQVPSGKTMLPKARIADTWSLEVIGGQVKVVNMFFINDGLLQFVVTDYKKIPWFIGHSFVVAGKPWSKSFIDDLIDPQIELNDRSSEEGDLIRVGSHMKFLAVNMPDFDPQSVKPGSGQVIFIEGENADFKPLPMTISPFPSADYINRVMEHLFNLGLPRIALAAGTAPYTGRVGAIQYQSVIDIVTDLRMQWEVVMRDLISTIQQYLIDHFPETHSFMREHIVDDQTGEMIEGELVIRDVEFDWENVLPLSRSDKVVDASTMRDRGAISLSTYLEEAGFRDPGKEIKKMKKEAKDEELMTLMTKFNQFSSGVVKAQLGAQQAAAAAAEAQASVIGQMDNAVNQPTSKTTAPILNQSQNDGRRGILSATGTPTGQTASPKGAVAQTTQNINAAAGV